MPVGVSDRLVLGLFLLLVALEFSGTVPLVPLFAAVALLMLGGVLLLNYYSTAAEGVRRQRQQGQHQRILRLEGEAAVGAPESAGFALVPSQPLDANFNPMQVTMQTGVAAGAGAADSPIAVPGAGVEAGGSLSWAMAAAAVQRDGPRQRGRSLQTQLRRYRGRMDRFLDELFGGGGVASGSRAGAGAGSDVGGVDYQLLIIFAGLFMVSGAFVDTGIPGALWAAIAGAGSGEGGQGQGQPFSTAGGTALLSVYIVLCSQLVGNVPLVYMAQDSINGADGGDALRCYSWLVLCWVATVGGNFMLTGSAANIIVAEKAARYRGVGGGVQVTFAAHFAVCGVVTVLSIATGVLLLYLEARMVWGSTI